MRAEFRMALAATVVAATLCAGAVAAPAAVAAWTASATAQFTQSSAAVPVASFTSCITGSKDATLLWAAAPATLNGSALKDYFVEWVYVAGGTIAAVATTTPTYVPAVQGLTGDSFVRVTVRYQNGWNTLVPTSYPFTTRTGQGRPQCNPDF